MEKTTIKPDLKGGDLKEGILLLKKLFEDLIRQKVPRIQSQCTDE